MKMFKSLKDMPDHVEGSLIIEREESYQWCEAPHYTLPKQIVEVGDVWFEMVEDGWENGEPFYYISTNFEVVEADFNAIQHHKLVLKGNAFKEKEAADWVNDKINRLINDDELIVTDSNHIKLIVTNLKTNNSDKAIKMLMGML